MAESFLGLGLVQDEKGVRSRPREELLSEPVGFRPVQGGGGRR